MPLSIPVPAQPKNTVITVNSNKALKVPLLNRLIESML